LPEAERNLIGLTEKVSLCCQQSLIPFLEKERDEYIIISAIMHELKKNKLDGYVGGSLKGLAEVLGFEYGQKKVGGKNMRVTYCNVERMNSLLGIEK
jgi:predicted RecB family nuclease